VHFFLLRSAGTGIADRRVAIVGIRIRIRAIRRRVVRKARSLPAGIGALFVVRATRLVGKYLKSLLVITRCVRYSPPGQLRCSLRDLTAMDGANAEIAGAVFGLPPQSSVGWASTAELVIQPFSRLQKTWMTCGSCRVPFGPTPSFASASCLRSPAFAGMTSNSEGLGKHCAAALPVQRIRRVRRSPSRRIPSSHA